MSKTYLMRVGIHCLSFLLLAAGCAGGATPPASATTVAELTPGPPISTVNGPPTQPVPTPGTPTPSLPYQFNPHAVIVEADVSGEFRSPNSKPHLTKYRLYGDGLVVFAGENKPEGAFDAEALYGYLEPAQVRALLAGLDRAGFFALPISSSTRAPADLPTTRLTVYSQRAKTASVYGAGAPGTAAEFNKAMELVLATRPAGAQKFDPSSGQVTTEPAGPAAGLPSELQVVDWPALLSFKPAAAMGGRAVWGTDYTTLHLLFRTAAPGFVREAGHVYGVTLAPAVPRSPLLSSVASGVELQPQGFAGQQVSLTGYFRYTDVLAEMGYSPPAQGDWILRDATGAIYVRGELPAKLNTIGKEEIWQVVKVNGTVTIENGHPLLKAVLVTPVETGLARPDPQPISSPQAAIGLVQGLAPELASIRAAQPGTFGGNSDVIVQETSAGWNLAFWLGWGDCPAGCINRHYFYYAADKSGGVSSLGEYEKIFDASTNSFLIFGAPQLGLPKS